MPTNKNFSESGPPATVSKMRDGKILRILSTLLLLLTVSLVSAQETRCPPGCSPGRWSTDAIDLSSRRVKEPYEDRDIRIYSPDHQKSFHVVNDHWWIEVGVKRFSLSQKDSDLLYPAEMAWAPDSRAFFITDSVGYSTGYRADVYQVTQDKLLAITKLSSIIQMDFDRHHRCFDGPVGNAPNVAGFKWLGGSDHLLFIAEVPPIGICKEAEYFGGYEIALASQQIVQRLSPQQLGDRWGEVLGERLKSNLGYLSAEAKTALP
jgi:hypothetical protein